ncbi:MAG: methionyl-tRNA formyltransferase [Pyrinomonadaceae bacterium]
MKIVFMGTPAAAARSLERLIADGHEVAAVYTQPDRPSGRGNKIVFSPVKEFAIAAGLRVLQPTKVKTAEAAEEFRAFNADLAIVVAYGRILPASFLTAFSGGAINVHFSLLPKYRGAAPVNWAIVNGETETGVTTMIMDAGLDTGPTLLQEAVPINAGENSIELMDRLGHLGADVLSRTLANLDAIVPKEQDNSLVSFAPILSKNDGSIDWTSTSKTILNRVRGFQPFPTAYTFLDRKRLTIWDAEAIDRVDHDAPGTIIESLRESLVIACGDGTAIRVDELQIEGKRRMSARDFINGVRPDRGTVLGGRIEV